MVTMETAVAQERITTDRPGFANGSYVLDPVTIQLESGAGFTRSGPADQYGLGQILLRFGIPGIELRAMLNSFVIQRTPASDEGLQDTGVGVKVRLVHKPDDGLAVSVLGALSLPTGKSFLTSNELVPTGLLLIDYTLSDRWALSSNLGYTFGTGGLDDEVLFIAKPTLSVSSAAGVYVGYVGLYGSPRKQHLVDWGLTWGATPNAQLDFHGGMELDTRDFFIGVGFATRLRK